LFASSRRAISHFLDRPDIRATLGVDPLVSENFSSCSATVGAAFSAAQDHLHGSTDYVGALLARQVRVLVYVGTYDWICNWIGNEAWTLALDWHGQQDFAALPLREWHVDGHVAGKTRSAHGLTFVTVDAAGHMVRNFSRSVGFFGFYLFPFRTYTGDFQGAV
jgi:carboxypeptidase C (cathepsin A)